MEFFILTSNKILLTTQPNYWEGFAEIAKKSARLTNFFLQEIYL
jgi:hypothetical protein